MGLKREGSQQFGMQTPVLLARGHFCWKATVLCFIEAAFVVRA